MAGCQAYRALDLLFLFLGVVLADSEDFSALAASNTAFTTLLIVAREIVPLRVLSVFTVISLFLVAILQIYYLFC